MNRREFLKVTTAGAITLFLSGCGLSALTGGEAKKNVVPEKGSVSGGRNMKIVVITSSPHPKEESTWRTGLQRAPEVLAMRSLPLMQPMRKRIPARGVTNAAWTAPVSLRMPSKIS